MAKRAACMRLAPELAGLGGSEVGRAWVACIDGAGTVGGPCAVKAVFRHDCHEHRVGVVGVLRLTAEEALCPGEQLCWFILFPPSESHGGIIGLGGGIGRA